MDNPFQPKIEQIAKGLAGRVGFAAQEIGGKEVIASTAISSSRWPAPTRLRSPLPCWIAWTGGALLDELVEVPNEMFVTGVVALAETFPHRGIQLSVANLIEVMITESDNTATDVSMELAGGSGGDREPAQARDHRFQG